MADDVSKAAGKDPAVVPSAGLEVSIAFEPVPKLPHEHDESVEMQTDGPKPAASNAAPSLNPRQKYSG